MFKPGAIDKAIKKGLKLGTVAVLNPAGRAKKKTQPQLGTKAGVFTKPRAGRAEEAHRYMRAGRAAKKRARAVAKKRR
jgi:hypothetical protein